MKNTRNIIKQLGISMLAALMLLCLVWGASAEGVTEVPLRGYATLTPTLSADSNKTPLPVYVENGQSLFFSLSIDSIKSADLVKKLKEAGTVDFTVPIDFVAFASVILSINVLLPAQGIPYNAIFNQ